MKKKMNMLWKAPRIEKKKMLGHTNLESEKGFTFSPGLP